MPLSVIEIAVRYGLTQGKLKSYMYNTKGFPMITGYREQKTHSKKLAVYDMNEVDAFFANLGIYPVPFEDIEITLTQAAYILELSFEHTKKLLQAEGFEPVGIRAAGALLYDRQEIEAFKAQRDKAPPVYRGPSRRSKAKTEPTTFNDMAQAFIRAATAIRPRPATCSGIISRVRTQGEWGIDL